MTYVSVSVICEGALEEEHIYADQTLFDELLGQLQVEADASGQAVEVYALWHDHAPCGDCFCLQYEQSLKPYRVVAPQAHRLHV